MTVTNQAVPQTSRIRYGIRKLCVLGGSILCFSWLQGDIIAHAWGDNEGGRPSYVAGEIENGAIGATILSDGEDYKSSPNYPGQIVFNSIIDSASFGNEKNYVWACEDCADIAADDVSYEFNSLAVKNGQIYTIGAYVHNNNPNGEDAVAENVKVRFHVPATSSCQQQVNGFITADNASPSEYVDYVNFTSDRVFHLEYQAGSARLQNDGIGRANGITLLDSIVDSESGGVTIGYDALDGRIPGGVAYASVVSIQVKVVFDDDFTVRQKVRVVGSDDKWFKNSINAQIGDIVEIQFEYRNMSDTDVHSNVAVRDVLPANLQYISGSTKLYSTNYPDGVSIDQDNIVTNGIGIGNYGPQANAFIRFRAKVVDVGMANGANEIVNWSQVQAGADEQFIVQDCSRIYVVKMPGADFSQVALIVLCILLSITCVILALKRQ